MAHKHSRLTSEGRLVWFVERLWNLAQELPVRQIPIDQIAEFDQNCWFGPRSLPICRAVAQHARRILEADLNYPIILSAEGYLMDGGHRIAKAYLLKMREVAAVQFRLDPEPDYVLAPEAPLPTEPRIPVPALSSDSQRDYYAMAVAADPSIVGYGPNRSRTGRMLPPSSLFLAGVPATGKSSFGNWLEEQKDYLHLDFDEEDIVQQQGFGQEQQLLWHQHQIEPLLQALIARHQPIVLTWGFAPHFLPTVTHMLTWGFVPIWFTAARDTARQAFIQRGRIDVKYFDQYMALMTPLEQEIIAVFGGHVLQPLQDDGTRLPFSAIYAQLLPWFV